VEVVDQKCLVFDPQDNFKVPKSGFINNKIKPREKLFAFDRVFDDLASQEEVYEGSNISQLLGSVLNGINVTVFAYGATGNVYY
jgi:kinesin family protein 18/19